MRRGQSGLAASGAAAVVLWALSGAAATLHVHVAPRCGSAPLAFDALAWTNRSGQVVSVERLDLLLSEFALRQPDGHWLELPDRYAALLLRAGRNRFALADIPAGTYDALRWRVGLAPAVNATDPAGYAPDHPLNPNRNGLHWSWLGGYVFLALEGRWQQPDGALGGYSFHLADTQTAMRAELPAALVLTGAVQELRVALDVARLWDGDAAVALAVDASATHSRAGDPLATALTRQVGGAFAVGDVRPTADAAPATAAATHADLPYRFTFSAQFPLPALPVDNPLTELGVALGSRLFFDPRLSGNGRQSCASCHRPAAAFSDAGRRYSLGAAGRAGRRHAMPLFNLAWKSSYFWDGRAPTLRAQALEPIQDDLEMHNTLPEVVARLAASPDYPAQFAAAFGPAAETVTAARVGLALEQYLLTRTADRSRFDRALRRQAELTPEEKRGFELFATEYDPRRGLRGADCFHCHGGPLFSNGGFANNGLDAAPADAGRAAVTGRSGDWGKFAVPSLRNVALTPPYMHDGRLATLADVVAHYAGGVQRSATLDPNLAKHPDGGVPLTAADRRALVAFLLTLTDE